MLYVNIFWAGIADSLAYQQALRNEWQ